MQASDESPDLVVVGKVRRPHGVQGEVLVEVLSDNPDRFLPGAKLLASGEEGSLATLRVVSDFSEFLSGVDELGTPTSVLDPIGRVNRLLHDDDLAFELSWVNQWKNRPQSTLMNGDVIVGINGDRLDELRPAERARPQ